MTEELSSRRVLLPIALGWSVLALGFVEWTAGSGIAFRPFLALADPRVGPAGFGALVTHAILCESDARKRIVLRLGVVLEIVRFVALAWQGTAIDVLAFSVGYGFLITAILDFLLHREWRSAALAALVPIGMASAPLGLAGIVRRMTPLTYDGALYALDGAFRFPFSKLAGDLVNAVPAIRAATLISYAALPGAIAAGLAYEEYNFRRGEVRGVGVNLLLAYTVSGTIAAILYIICPGAGPFHAFPNAFPDHLPDPSTVPHGLAPFAPLSPRNAMPSLHFAWGVLLWRSTWGARRTVRITAAVFALFTLVATIGSGEHYVVDLIAAVPFLVALEAACAHKKTATIAGRLIPLSAGLAFYSIWILMARNAETVVPFLRDHAAIVWAIAAATLLVSSAVALKGSKNPQFLSRSIVR